MCVLSMYNILLEYIMLTLICLFLTHTLAAIPDDIPDIYCQGLIGLIGASCDMTTHRCVKTLPGLPPYMTAHDCSAPVIEATAAEYDRLRQIVLANLRPSNTAERYRISHSREIHLHLSLPYFEFLRRAPPISTHGVYRDIRVLLDDFQGSFDSIKAMVDIYLTIPGVKWVSSPSNFVQMVETYLYRPWGQLVPWFSGENPNDVRESQRRAILETYDGVIQETRLFTDDISGVIKSYLGGPAVSRNIEKVFLYHSVKQDLSVDGIVVRFGYDDYMEYDLAVREAVNEITDYRNGNPGNDENACKWLLAIYEEMVTSSFASRPKLAPIEKLQFFDFDDGFRKLFSANVIVYPIPPLYFVFDECLTQVEVNDEIPAFETIDLIINSLLERTVIRLCFYRRQVLISILLTVIKDIGWTDIYARIHNTRSIGEWKSFTAFKSRPMHFAAGLHHLWSSIEVTHPEVPEDITIAFAKIVRRTQFVPESFRRFRGYWDT